jgi:ATP-dependent protease ClpP protease subunit
MNGDEQDEIPEIAVAGDLTDREGDLTQQVLDVPPGGRCVIYFDSPGGAPYTGMSLMSLILLRDLRATGVVTGECSSAALWPFAACSRRLVVSHSVLLFHPMKWQSEEHVGLAEAAEWARHFGQLETDMDVLLAELFGISKAAIDRWMQPGRYVSGRELAESGLAELIDLKPLKLFEKNGAPRRRKAAGARR